MFQFQTPLIESVFLPDHQNSLWFYSFWRYLCLQNFWSRLDNYAPSQVLASCSLKNCCYCWWINWDTDFSTWSAYSKNHSSTSSSWDVSYSPSLFLHRIPPFVWQQFRWLSRPSSQLSILALLNYSLTLDEQLVEILLWKKCCCRFVLLAIAGCYFSVAYLDKAKLVETIWTYSVKDSSNCIRLISLFEFSFLVFGSCLGIAALQGSCQRHRCGSFDIVIVDQRWLWPWCSIDIDISVDVLRCNHNHLVEGLFVWQFYLSV